MNELYTRREQAEMLYSSSQMRSRDEIEQKRHCLREYQKSLVLSPLHPEQGGSHLHSE